MAVNISKFDRPLLYEYHYDQLNRLDSMQAYDGLNTATNLWTASATTDYKEKVNYDPNGNILSYLRHGTTANSNQANMDDLTYHYYYESTDLDGSGNHVMKSYNPGGIHTPDDLTDVYQFTNRLAYVDDAVSSGNYPSVTDDTKDVDDQSAGNYVYDKIGNLVKDQSEGIDEIVWTVYGKIASITRSSGSTITYTYDASGNRTSKTVVPASSLEDIKKTWYVRDASGNVMAVYESGNSSLNSGHLSQTEVDLYGSSRLGMWRSNRDVQVSNWWVINATSLPGTDGMVPAKFVRGETSFELSNHLGNVLSTISDKKLQVDNNSDGETDTYSADILSATDYYPFGMAMPGRHYDAGVGYRYGFNGKEQDKDINSLTAYDYGFRIYNPGIGRFLSVDPLTKRYPNYSTYQFSGNNPVMFVDIDGLERGWRNPITGEIKEAGPVSGVDGIQNSDGWILFTAIKSSGEIGASFGVPKRSLPISSSQLQPSSDYLVSVRTIQVHQSVLRRTVPQKKFEIDIVQQDIYGIAHIGKESEVHAEVEGAKAQYQAAVGDNIRGGLWGATGYLIGGDKGSFYGAIADNIVLSFAGVPGNSNILSRRPIELEQQKVPALNEDIKIRENSVSHIFTNEHGLQNTVANRQVLLDLARSKENLLGVDKFGNEWYAQLNVEGKQIWAQVRNGEIFNGGVNNSPKSFDPLTGLSKNLNDLKNK